MTAYRALVVGAVSPVARELGALGNVVQQLSTTSTLLADLGRSAWDVCVIDIAHLQLTGSSIIRQLRELHPHLAVIVAGPEHADFEPTALASGADDWVSLPSQWRLCARIVAHSILDRRRRASLRPGAPDCHVVLLDGDPVESASMRAALAAHQFQVTSVTSELEALRQLRSGDVHVLLTPPTARLRVGGVESPLVESALSFDPRLRVVVTSDVPDLGDVGTAMAAGAQDYLLRPIGPEQALGAARDAWKAYQNTAPTGEPTLRGLRVLIVHPREVTARLIEQMLGQERRITPVSLRDVRVACNRLLEHEFDAVVCGPDTDGSDPLGIIHRIRAQDVRPAIVLVSDESDPALQDRALRFGAQDVIAHRVLGREALGNRLRNAVKRHQHHLQHERFVRDLQRREASQHEVVRRSADGLLIVDDRGVVVFANPAAEAMLTRSVGLLGSVFDFDLTEGRPREIQLQGAQERWAEMTTVSINWNGSRSKLVALRDITERRHAQTLRDRLTHAERLAAIGQLAAGVTHEINNPAAYVVANLSTMQRQVSRLLRELGDAHPEAAALTEMAEMLAENLDGMNRIRSISSDLRTFARIDSTELTPVNLNECVVMARKIAFNEIRPRAHLVEELAELPTFIGSPGKIAQVVTNLLVNAAQAIPEGDPNLHRITVRTGVDEQSVWVSVEDTGSGIPESVRDKMFDPFFTTKTRSQGTGLGLALCTDIVRQHDGEIRAENLATGGARFEVTFPRESSLTARRPSPSRHPPSQVQVKSPGHLRVLLVDDERLLLRSLKRMLAGHDVVTASGGAEALRTLATDTGFDLIFCDLIMPGIDGPTLYAELEKVKPELLERLVFYSGGAFTPRTRRFVEEAARPLVEKPLTLEAFNRVAAEVCSLRRDGAGDQSTARQTH